MDSNVFFQFHDLTSGLYWIPKEMKGKMPHPSDNKKNLTESD